MHLKKKLNWVLLILGIEASAFVVVVDVLSPLARSIAAISFYFSSLSSLLFFLGSSHKVSP